MEFSDWIIASLSLVAGASYVRAARFRRQRDEASERATRLWNRWRETRRRTVAERNGNGSPGGSGEKLDVIAEVSLDEALGIADAMESRNSVLASAAPAAVAGEPVDPGEPVILPFRKFWVPDRKPHRGA